MRWLDLADDVSTAESTEPAMPELLAGFHADHLVPKATGGSDDGLNRVLACTLCNTIKGGYDPSHGAGPPRTEEDRRRIICDAKQEISRRAGSSPATKYWRVFHLCCLLTRKGC